MVSTIQSNEQCVSEIVKRVQIGWRMWSDWGDLWQQQSTRTKQKEMQADSPLNH